MHHVLEGPKLVDAREAVTTYVRPGTVLGLGGQNINRCPMSLVHEVVRQGTGDLTVVGCNLSLPLDLLVAAGLVSRTEQGSGNLEKYGTLFSWRRRVEDGTISVRDYSHLGMATRFLAGAMGVPFMPTRSMLGSDVLAELARLGDAQVLDDPWTDDPVVLLRALRPDVSLIHGSRADTDGNVVIDGVTSHEIDMVRASHATIVSVEEVLPRGAFDDEPERVTLSSAYVTALVHQPFGAFPTSVYRQYDYWGDDISAYQAGARAGDEGAQAWLDSNVRSTRSFDDYLDKRDPDGSLRNRLREQMRSLLCR